MSDLWSDRLSEYLDGELATADHAELERHLLTCAECARDLDGLRQVALRARALPNAAPAADLWPAIQRRIARSPRRVFALPRFELPSHFHFTLPQAVAAGVALMLISGVSVYLVLHQMSAPLAPARGGVSGISRVTGPTATLTPNVTPAPATQPRLREGTAPATSSAAAVAMTGALDDPTYDQAIAELENTLAAHRAELDTSTVRIVEQNLAIIDRAIDQARRALAADPASPYLHQHLALQMKAKLELLRRTTALAAAQG